MIGISLFLLVLLPVVFMTLFSLFKRPSWIQDSVLSPQWKKINIGSLLGAIVLSAASYFWIHSSFIIEFKIVNSLAISLLVFIFGQTFFTDGWLRLADRRILRIANLTSLIVGLFFMLVFGNSTLIIIYLIFALLATIIVFLPMIGASDGRAIQLIVLSTFPILGFERLQWGILLFLPILALYWIFNAVKNKSIKGLLSKISVPMVPLMLAPFIIVLMLPAF